MTSPLPEEPPPDRDEPRSPGPGWGRWLVAALLLVAGVVAFLHFHPAPPPPVPTTTPVARSFALPPLPPPVAPQPLELPVSPVVAVVEPPPDSDEGVLSPDETPILPETLASAVAPAAVAPAATHGGVVYEEALPEGDSGHHPRTGLPIPGIPGGKRGLITPPRLPELGGRLPVAVVIDDLGYNGPVSLEIARLDADVTLAILPGGGSSRGVAVLGSSRGKEVILHQPMEPLDNGISPGRGALFAHMDAGKVASVLEDNLAQFPEAVGINNHMGSRFTQERAGMATVMSVLARRGLYFLDSRTANRSVGLEEAFRHGVPATFRQVFLDNRQDTGAILAKLAELEQKALLQGGAVAIGHPYPETLAALRRWLPGLGQRGFQVVRASQFVFPESARLAFRGQVAARP